MKKKLYNIIVINDGLILISTTGAVACIEGVKQQHSCSAGGKLGGFISRSISEYTDLCGMYKTLKQQLLQLWN